MVPSGLMADVGQITEQGERQIEHMKSQKAPDEPRTLQDPVLRLVPVVPREVPKDEFVPTENDAVMLGHAEITEIGKQVADSNVNIVSNYSSIPDILCRETDRKVAVLHQFWIRTGVSS